MQLVNRNLILGKLINIVNCSSATCQKNAQKIMTHFLKMVKIQKCRYFESDFITQITELLTMD